MEPTLTPHLALAYLRELSTDVRGGIVFDRGGALLAGEVAIEPGARALLRAGARRTWVQVRATSGWVFAASCAEGAVVLVTGPHALPGLARHDLGAVLSMVFPGHLAAERSEVPGSGDAARHGATALAAREAPLPFLAEDIHGALLRYAARPGADR